MASLEGQGTDKRKNWRVIYYWQGQKKYIRIGITNRRTALLRKSQIESILASGLDPEVEIMKNADNVSISTLLTRDNEWCKHRRQQGTIDLNNFAMDQLIEFLGDIKISSISQNRIEKFLNYLRDDLGWKKSSCNIYLRHLKAIFQRAIDEYDDAHHASDYCHYDHANVWENLHDDYDYLISFYSHESHYYDGLQM